MYIGTEDNSNVRKLAAEARQWESAFEENIATSVNIYIVNELHEVAVRGITHLLARHYYALGLPQVRPANACASHPGALAHLAIHYQMDDLAITILGSLAWDEDAPKHKALVDLHVKVLKIPNVLAVESTAEHALDLSTGNFAYRGQAYLRGALEAAIARARSSHTSETDGVTNLPGS